MYEELYEENKNTLYAIAQHFRGLLEKDNAVSIEDLTQAAFLGLVRAKKDYDSGPGKSWAICKKRHITSEIYASLGIKRGQSNKPPLSLDASLGDDTEDSNTLIDLLRDDSLPDIDEALLRDEAQQSVRDSINRLADPRQRQVLVMVLEGRNLIEIAGILDVTECHVTHIYNRAVANLARDNILVALANLDNLTQFYRHKSIKAVLRDGTSVTEEAALWRIEQKEKINRYFTR